MDLCLPPVEHVWPALGHTWQPSLVDEWQVVTRRQAVRGLTIFAKLSRKGHCLASHQRPISLPPPLSLPHSYCVTPVVLHHS